MATSSADQSKIVNHKPEWQVLVVKRWNNQEKREDTREAHMSRKKNFTNKNKAMRQYCHWCYKYGGNKSTIVVSFDEAVYEGDWQIGYANLQKYDPKEEEDSITRPSSGEEDIGSDFADQD